MNRLSLSRLASLSPSIKQFSYDRKTLKPGIVHLGIGAFHRAHQAAYTEQVLNSEGGEWGIIGVSLRSPDVNQQMMPQDNLYTLIERHGESTQTSIIGAVIKTLVAPAEPAAVIEAMSLESVAVISLTVTEKGYCHHPSTGELNFSHPDIEHDLVHLDKPKSAIGFIVASLAQRKERNFPAPTIMSCDNLPNNGQLLRHMVLAFAERHSPSLYQWISECVAFPSTMVDRIVPATTQEERDMLARTFGYDDHALVVGEQFSQWVIEDWFSNRRPAWENHGAIFTSDVHAFETMKLRLLNGAHSIMAYTGYLSGLHYINDVMEQPAFVNMIKQYMSQEAGPLVDVPAPFSLSEYQQQLLMRFENPSLKHRTWQIAMDGSQKLPQRLLGTLATHLKANGPIETVTLGIAAWIRYVSATDETGQPIDVKDPHAQTLRELYQRNASSERELARAFLSFETVFGTDLQHNERAIDAIAQWLSHFAEKGVKQTIIDAFPQSMA
jgi:fructuronate reductase